jgi:hypothetical protein
MTDESVIDRILVKIQSTHITSAWQVMKIASENAGQQRPGAVVREAIMRLLPGPDQVWDTDDDIIDKDVAMDLSLLMETKAFGDITASLASHNLVQKAITLVTRCFGR